MGKDGDSDDLESGLNPELEAQIVALIHGELSGDALEAVEAEIAKDPAARVYRERILSVHEVLGESSFGAEDTEWTLAPERKEQLLETLSGDVSPASQQDMINLKDLREKRTQVAGRRAMWSLAACFCFTLVLVTLVTEPWIVLEEQNSAETATDSVGSAVEFGKQAPDTPKLLLQSEPMAEAAQFAEDFDAFGESSPPEKREAPAVARRQRALEKSTGDNLKREAARAPAPASKKVEDALSALDEEPVSPPAVTQRPAVDPKALNSALSEGSPFAASQAAAISEAVESSEEAGLEPQTEEVESQRERADEASADHEVGGEEKRREVAFLGLGVFLGLLLGVLFGLGLGRTWQRRAHSSH